jgi:hypothetical protein
MTVMTMTAAGVPVQRWRICAIFAIESRVRRGGVHPASGLSGNRRDGRSSDHIDGGIEDEDTENEEED